MLVFLVACNVLTGIAVGLAFRARAIVIAAPLMAASTLAFLLVNGFGTIEALLWTGLCLFLSQLAFLLVTVLEFRAPRTRSAEAPHVGLSKTPEA
ncbi:hypothetical protein DWF00_03055 [Bosea caraganae]|uniref:Uncharacterized protein n=1 Tax=Bosea caraganae TaxID=2763117 RepID=A0A370L634_9HYPH|nr:hypothetical protein [Bosea caraganae]RDJ24085.1 hypothetical protein DWE98_14285 [Bosea caraganae]RDJ30127.1 hypothetical protein DWF00_03055 [Bosea caraganae]